MPSPTVIRSSGRITRADAIAATAATADRIGPDGYRAAPMPRDIIGAGSPPDIGERRTHTEGVAWCRACGAAAATADGIRHAAAIGRRPGCPGADIIGARIPAALDGPRATDPAARVIRAAHVGTGHDIRPDVTPDIIARGAWRTRVTAARADGGRVTVARVGVFGWHALAAGAARPDGIPAERHAARADALRADADALRADAAAAAAAAARHAARADALAAMPPPPDADAAARAADALAAARGDALAARRTADALAAIAARADAAAARADGATADAAATAARIAARAPGAAVHYGIGRAVTAAGAPSRGGRANGRRRSRAAIIAATAPAPAPADPAVTADAAAMLAAGVIG